MAENVVSGRTRGEYGRGLNLDAITDAQGFTFVCPKVQSYMIQLRQDKNTILNGELVKTPGIEVRFVDYRYSTRDEEIAELLRKSSAFKKGKIKELAAAKKEKVEQKQKSLREQIEADPDLKTALMDELKKGKSEVPSVSKPKTKQSKKAAEAAA